MLFIIGQPTPVVRWSKAYRRFLQGRVQSNSTALRLFNVHKTDADNYLCTASNILESAQFTKEIIGCGPASLVYQETSSKAGSLNR